MPAAPATSIPAISPGEMQLLVSRTGLVLNPGQVADLVLAWRQVAGLIASLPPNRPMVDDMALIFRLPPPTVASNGMSGAAPKPRVASVSVSAAPEAASMR